MGERFGSSVLVFVVACFVFLQSGCASDSMGNEPLNGSDVVVDATLDGGSDGGPAPTMCSSDDECSDGICEDGECVAVNQPPVAIAGSAIESEMGSPIVLDGSESYDPEGEPLTYRWSFTKLPQGSALENVFAQGAVFTFLPDVEGLFELTLVVSDGALDSSPSTIEVTVTERTGSQLAEIGEECTSHLDCQTLNCVNGVCSENLPPLAFAGKDTYAATGSLVRFLGVESFDPEGSFLSYTWTLVSGPDGEDPVLYNPYSASASTKLDVAGVYVFGLVVHDGLQPSEMDEVVVTVADPDFYLAPYLDWMQPGVDVYKLLNVSFSKTTYFDGAEYGLPGEVRRTWKLWTPDYHEEDISHLGVSASGWVDGVGRVTYGNNGEYGISLFHPPLVGYPHGVFIDHEIVSMSRFTAPQEDGTMHDTIHKRTVRAVGLTNVETSYADYAEALEVVIISQEGTGLESVKICWLVEGIGSVRCERPAPSNSTYPPGIEELLALSFEVESAPQLDLPSQEHDIPFAEINVDGDGADWENVPYAYLDALGDHYAQEGSFAIDLAGVKLAQNETNLYVYIVLHDPPMNADVMYSFELMQDLPGMQPSDFGVWIRKDNGNWYGALEQLVQFGNPSHLGSVQIASTSQALEIRIPLDVSGGTDPLAVRDIVDGGYIRVSACLSNQNVCTDQFMGANRLHLTEQ